MSVAQSSSGPSLGSHKGAPHGGALIFIAFIVSAVLAAFSLIVTSGDGSRAAGELVTRFALLIFVSFLLVGPLARLFPTRFLRAVAQERENLRLAFVTTFAVSLACIIAPVELSGANLSAGAFFYFGFNSMVLIVTMFTARRATVRLLGLPAWRAIRTIATAYFWLAFALSDVARLSGDTDGNGWYMFSLIVLIGTLLTALAAHYSSRPQVDTVNEPLTGNSPGG
ncbi:MAG: hypothetical protein ACXWLW_07865 [Rhizomicrobium sp.]